jgi:hypothetical protein
VAAAAVFAVVGQLRRVQLDDPLHLLRRRGAGEAQREGKTHRSLAVDPLPHDAAGQRLGRLDVDRVVERDERLDRRARVHAGTVHCSRLGASNAAIDGYGVVRRRNV